MPIEDPSVDPHIAPNATFAQPLCGKSAGGWLASGRGKNHLRCTRSGLSTRVSQCTGWARRDRTGPQRIALAFAGRAALT